MELEVRVIGGIESCFVSLPLSLIQTLEATRGGGFLPPVLALELRSHSGDRWNVAWSGSASKSAAIEVDQLFAECIALPNLTRVQVKAIASIPKAEFVHIEPCSEDDWEILELNSELAEQDILKQVGVIYEGMKFPVWLHGHVVIEFVAASISPNKSVVQLVPGTEVAVVPKRRKKGPATHQDVQKQNSMNETHAMKALLRVQAEDRKYVHELRLKDFKLGVVLTTVAFMHPDTAKRFFFDDLQLATILPRSSKKEVMQNANMNQKRGKQLSAEQEDNAVKATSNEKPRRVILRIAYSDLVAKGHVMLPQAVRLFIGSDLHSWVYVKKYLIDTRKDLLSMTLSPCRFKGHEKSKDATTGTKLIGSHTYMNHKELSSNGDFVNARDISGLPSHENLLSSLSHEDLHKDDGSIYKYLTVMGSKLLFQSWLVGQIGAVASQNKQMKIESVVLAHETLLHFEITDCNLGSKKEDDLPASATFGRRNQNRESTVELWYLLRIAFQESAKVDYHDSYEIVLNTMSKNFDDLHDLEPLIGILELGDPVIMDSISESKLTRKSNLNLSSVSWLEMAIPDTVTRLTMLSSPTCTKLLSIFSVHAPGHVLIYGPSGSGKTTLVRAIAKHFEEHEEILAHIVYIDCLELSSLKSQKVREAISGYMSEVLDHSPSIVIFDNLDNIISDASDNEGSLTFGSTTSLVKYLTDMMDEYGEKSRISCGYGPVAFMASLQSLHNLPESLRSSGRFDYHVQLPVPGASERAAILKYEIRKHSFHCSEDIISHVATKCDGYSAHDLEILVLRSVNVARSRISASNVISDQSKHNLVKEDFLQEMQEFVPEAMRGLIKASSESGPSSWDDVGGLDDVRNAIQEMLELPSKFPNVFAQSPLRLRSNVLLYGPPGCGKTHIVGAAAAACSLRFIYVKGPELLNKYIGASEQAVRDLFSKATAAAPCLLFFDEFDAIAPQRGHDNTGVTDRVVNQLLTELDGVESLTGVFVFAATSRPDLLDAALLRPGRLDRLLFCDFPSLRERVDILNVLSRKVSLANDVDLEAIASITEGFTGADLQAIMSDALIELAHERYDEGNNEKLGEVPVITDKLLRAVASKARPSVPEAEKRRLYGIYSQFLDSRKSAGQSRDAKGKKATLA